MGVVCFGAELKMAPRPLNLRVTLSRLGALPRTAGGRAVICSPRSALRSVSIVWEDLSGDEAAHILAEISEGAFIMSYPDPLEGGIRQAEFVCGSREAQISWARDGEMRVSRLTCSLTEV